MTGDSVLEKMMLERCVAKSAKCDDSLSLSELANNKMCAVENGGGYHLSPRRAHKQH